jgi:hypothetical protein
MLCKQEVEGSSGSVRTWTDLCRSQLSNSSHVYKIASVRNSLFGYAGLLG